MSATGEHAAHASARREVCHAKSVHPCPGAGLGNHGHPGAAHETPRPRTGDQFADRRRGRRARCHHRRRGGRGRSHHAHLGRRQARPWSGPGADRRHRRSSPRQGQPRPGLRRVVHSERQRRDDRDDLAPGKRDSRRPHRNHQHPQRGRRPRRHPGMAGHPARPSAVGPPGGGRDLRRPSQRHQRFPRQAVAHHRGAGRGQGRPGGRGQRGRRDRYGLPPVQGRDWHGVARARGRTRGLHRRGSGAMQLWAAAEPARGRRSGRSGDSRSAALHRFERPRGPAADAPLREPGVVAKGRKSGRRDRLDHRSGGDRRAPPSAPTEASRHPRGSRRGPERRDGGQRFGRHLRRVLDRQRQGGRRRNDLERRDAAQPEDGSPVRGHRPGDRGSDSQRHARGRNHDRRRPEREWKHSPTIGSWPRCASTAD